MSKTAEDYRAESKKSLQMREESFERSDTDGFLSQWAHGLNAQLANEKARLVENDHKARFVGLYEGTRRVKARIIEARYGNCWMLDTSETDLISRRGSKFIPIGARSRVQKGLGLTEKFEMAPAWAKLDGRGTGLSGQCWVAVFRTGDKWGSDAVLAENQETD